MLVAESDRLQTMFRVICRRLWSSGMICRTACASYAFSLPTVSLPMLSFASVCLLAAGSLSGIDVAVAFSGMERA